MYNLNMIRKTFIFSLLVLGLSSCQISIVKDPNGSYSIYDGTSTMTSISYTYTSNDLSIENLNKQASLTFYNEYSEIGSLYDNVNQIYSDITNVNNINYSITNFSNCYQGINSILIGKFGNDDGSISFKFDKAYSYVEIIACPVYAETLDYETGQLTYKIYNSCLSVNNSNYLLLDSSLDVNKKPIISNLVFKLNSDTLNILSGLDQAFIMEVNLY